MKELLVAALCLTTLAACGGSGGGDMTEDPEMENDMGDDDADDTGDDPTLTLDASLLGLNDSFPTNNFREEVSVSITADGSNGYAFQAGVLSDNFGLIANANLLTGGLGFQLTDPPASGTATLESTYDAVRLSNPTTANGQVEVTTTRQENAPITLTADFTPAGLATLTGTDGTLTVDGQFSPLDVANGSLGTGSLNGTVTYEGVTGDLTGFVGGAETIGAFSGQDDDSVFAGGFASN